MRVTSRANMASFPENETICPAFGTVDESIHTFAGFLWDRGRR
jgi:hypothetical protein